MTEETRHETGLTSAELANLWTQYMTDSLALCVNRHLLTHCQDEQVQTILEHSITLSESHIKKIKFFLNSVNHPIPQGFTEEDVNPSAPRLFSDTIALVYIRIMTLHGLTSYALCVSTSVHSELRSYYNDCLLETRDLYDHILNVMVEQGVISKPPKLNAPGQVDFVSNQNYLAGWFHRRPLNAIEISGLFYNMEKTEVKVFLEIGFSQVAKSKEAREYMKRGVKICEKHLNELGNMLERDHLSTPTSWESEVTRSTVSPFSDKLMIFQVLSLVSVAIGYYGAALSGAQRRDIILMYTKLIGEIGLYAEDGINLLIKNNWMEQPPLAENREELANK